MIIENREQLLNIMRRRSQNDRYEWTTRPGFDFTKKADPEVIGKHLEGMAEVNGGTLTTTMIADDGDRIDSPLYPLFEHDMEVAALKWRHHEARNLIGSLVIVKTVASDDPGEEPQQIRVRGFLHASSDEGNIYAPVYVVAKVPDLRDQVEKRLLTEIRSWQQRARDFALFDEIVSAIDELSGSEQKEGDNATQESELE